MLLRIGALSLLIASVLVSSAAATDGGLDHSWGGSGKVLTVLDATSPVNSDQAFKVLVQADQKILVVGWITDISDPSDMAVVRYTPTGELDHSFGTNGVAKVSFGFLALNEAFAAVLQPDGKIVIGGFTSALAGSPAFALVRLKTNGAPDPRFGSGGLVQTDLRGDDWVFALAVQTDGKILATGITGTIASHNFALVRYLANGSVDTTFGTRGKVVTDFSGREDRPAAIAVQTDGKIVVAGYSAPSSASNNGSSIALARYTTAGKLDTTFGTGGTELLHIGSSSAATAVKVLGSGKILVGGGTTQSSSTASDFLVVRLNANGALDTTFGSAGKVVTNFGKSDSIHAMAVLTNGMIVVGGEVEATSFTSGDGSFGLARYTAAGALDTTFGTAGKVVTQLGSRGSRCTSIAVQADGKIVAAGHVFSLTPTVAAQFGVARYLASVPAVQEIEPESEEAGIDEASTLPDEPPPS